MDKKISFQVAGPVGHIQVLLPEVPGALSGLFLVGLEWSCGQHSDRTLSLQDETRLSSGGVEGTAPVERLVREDDWEGGRAGECYQFLTGDSEKRHCKSFP